MVVPMTMDVPVSREDAEAVSAAMSPDDPPQGLIAYVMTKTPDGVRVVDIWESPEDFQKFNEAPEIHKLVKPCEYVFLIEDDGALPPPDALSRLLADYQAHPYAGFIEGVELGRWGIPMIGAWRADDVCEPSVIETVLPARPELLNDTGRAVGRVPEEIDAGGLYCALAKYEHYLRHEFRPFDGDALGPDFNWGIELRRQGYKNYVDYSVAVEHCKPDGTSIHPRSTNPVQMRFVREGSSWSGKVIEGW